MALDFKEIFEVLGQIVSENYILILAIGNVLALIISIIAIVKAAKNKKNCGNDDLPSDLSLGTVNVKVELADVKLGHADVNYTDGSAFSDEQEASVNEDSTKIPNSPVEQENSEPLVIEKLIPIKQKPAVMDERDHNPKEFCTGKSGRVYSEEELKNQIKD